MGRPLSACLSCETVRSGSTIKSGMEHVAHSLAKPHRSLETEQRQTRQCALKMVLQAHMPVEESPLSAA